MMMLTPEQVTQTRALALRVADGIMDFYCGELHVSHKSDASPVTQADLAASRILEAELPRIADFPVLSEENTPTTPQWQQWPTYWLIDPIDGTKHFINRSGDFCVCIALIHQHQVVFGLIIAPTTGELWLAQQAPDNAASGRVQKFIRDQAVALPDNHPARLTATLSAATLTPKMQTLLDALSPDYHWYRRGSALKYTDIVEGKATLYAKMWDTCEWDSAAGQCILTCHGGAVLRLDNGKPLRYGEKPSLLNPHFIAYSGLNSETLTTLFSTYRSMN